MTEFTNLNRRHDLDALRALAMFLGIILHACLPFIGVPWAIQDNQQNDGMGLLVAAIHGFRMPLFFLMSGFFTAMLWRQKGLKGLVVHRLNRVGLPLLLGLITVIPTVSCIWVVAEMDPLNHLATDVKEDHQSQVFLAAKTGNVDKLKRLLSTNMDLNNSRDSKFGLTPLSWASINGHTRTVEFLIREESSVKTRNEDGGTPLHTASFLGRANVVEILIDSGADVNALNNNKQTPLDVLKTDPNSTTYIMSLLEIEIDPKILEKQRIVTATILAEHGAETNQVSKNKSDKLMNDYSRIVYEGLLGYLIFVPILHHLWFLWFLLWLVAGFVIFVKTSKRMGLNRFLPKRIVLSPINLLLIIPMTAIPQTFMGSAGSIPIFGADTSTGLIPLPHLLVYYAIFFGFGALYFECNDTNGKLGMYWWAMLPIALLLVFPASLLFTFGTLGLEAETMELTLQRPISIMLQSSYPWLISFGLMGLFQKIMKQKNHHIRYLSDASYWLYIAHLPLVLVTQAILLYWNVHPLIKVALILIVVNCILLFLYKTIVRHTWLGTLLNGPRSKPTKVHT